MDTYQQVVEFLFDQLPMYQRIGGKALKKDLGNIKKLCHYLGHPHCRFPSVHVAGTNGKGSVSHMIAAVLQSAGYKVGLYTSPHYLDFRERIKINGQLIQKEAVIEFIEHLKSYLKKYQPSFFEITVAMAFYFFAKEKVDIAVIETGLGGRLDSTNIILPIQSVITNISFDHQQFLGNTLPLIAAEKAGIIKKGVPVLVGEHQENTDHVFKATAKIKQADLLFAEDAVKLDVIKSELDNIHFVLSEPTKWSGNYSLGIGGPFQVKNLITTIACIDQIHEIFSITKQHLAIGLSDLKEITNFKGRWEVLHYHPLVISDSGHNEAGIRQVVDQLKKLPGNSLKIVLGFVKDKSLDTILPLFPKDATYYFCTPDIPRGLNTLELKSRASVFGLEGTCHPSVQDALQRAKSESTSEDVIFIGGSSFVVSEAIS